ncbi:ribosome biogenesis GTPase Der [Sphingosinicella microcystinivorans]|uniref:ribosome biogenesis GTPase Der n=1 Tax=Sphingosinicella microcystinivorans TaxID=335406 RepID=UPI0022F3C2EE|nr:ribosome biogenesis GTPase Der [Sphingosinicella microcystinivorans]WBX84894.1 ribosome biogenesis GTPase Der [Sphingosinicella microcystinivorans]
MTSTKPKVVIIGRPNVGKSTLFNRLVGKRLALVDDTPGVTRDRREGDATLFDLDFIAVDTAGLEDAGPDTLSGRMRAQTEAALEDAAAALLVIDSRAGLTPMDRHFADWLRTAKVPVVLVANKAEGRSGDAGILEAYALGFGEPVGISAEHGEGLADLFEALAPHVDAAVAAAADESDAEGEAEGPLKLAIVGRPNAGKSTLINTLLGQDRLVTGPEAGITRDSIAIEWTWQGRPVRLIDTAGVRKKAKVQEKLEKLSVADTRRAIDFAEVVVLLLDATLGLEAQDLRIADMVIEEGRALVIAFNKWDAAEDQSRLFQGVRKALEEGLAQIKGVPLLTVSGMTGKGLDTLVKVAFEQREAWSRRVPTSRLNRWFEGATARNPPPAPDGKRLKLRYVTQVNTRPPSFVIFGNRLTELPESYRRYLVNSLRDDLGFTGVPIRLTLRGGKNPFDRDRS